MDKQKLTDEELDQVTGGDSDEYNKLRGFIRAKLDGSERQFNMLVKNLIAKTYNISPDKISFEINKGTGKPATFSIPGHDINFNQLYDDICEYHENFC